MLMDMHHIIGDAVTAAAILHRISEGYAGVAGSLPDGPVYTDYACWLAGQAKALAEREREYWISSLEELPPLPEIPADFPRPKAFDYAGEALDFSLSEEALPPLRYFLPRKGVHSISILCRRFRHSASPN